MVALVSIAHAQELVPPTLVDAPEVTLPEGAEPLPEGSAVELALTIDATGAITEAQVLSGVRPDVDALVLEAASAMHFTPAMRDGVAIPSRIRFRFGVSSPAPPPPVESAPPTDVEPPADAEPESPPPEPNLQVELPAEEESFGARAEVVRPEPGAATRVTLRAEELTVVPGTFGEPLRVVATLPGVARSPFGLGFFVVRGASFENTGFLVDGYPVPLLYHLGAGPAVLSSRLVTQLDFYPGGYPARYGRFSAGVISLETGAPPAERLHLETEIDFFRASALAVVPFDEGRGVVTAAVRRSYYELLLPLILDDLSLSYSDWQLRADYRFGGGLSGSLFYFASNDALDIAQPAGAGISGDNVQTAVSYGFHRFIGKLVLRTGEETRIQWSGSLGFDDTSLERIDPGGLQIRAGIDGLYLGQRVEATTRLASFLSLSGGVDLAGTLYRSLSTLPSPPGLGELPKPVPDLQTTDIEIRTVQVAAAPYVESIWRLGPLELTTGLRLDHMRYANVSRVDLDPRAVARLRLSDDLVIKAASGLFLQTPQAFQIDRTFGNPTIRPQRAWQSSAGVELHLPYSFEVESSLFYSHMWRIARTTNELIDDGMGGLRRRIYVDDGLGRAYGLELLLRRRVAEGLFGWLSYTLSWSERFLENGQTVPFLFDQRHVLNFALSYKTGNWRFGARFTLATGRPERPVQGAVYDADADRYSAARGGFTARLPTYHQLDLRVDRDFTIGDVRGSVYLDVLNAYYAQNSEGTLYQYDFQASQSLPGLPILGTLGLRLEFEP